MKLKWIPMTSFAAALSMAVPGTAQVPAQKAKSSTKKAGYKVAKEPAAKKVKTHVKN